MMGIGGSYTSGIANGLENIQKFGVNRAINIATCPEVIWNTGGQFPFLDAGILMDIKSTSANDTLSGTGAQKVKVTFFDDANVEYIQTFDLNGLTAVQIPVTAKIVTFMEVVQAGTSGGNEGDIKVVDRASGLIVYQSISQGNNISESAVYIIPAGKKGKVVSVFASYIIGGTGHVPGDLTFMVRRSGTGIKYSLHPCSITTDNASELHGFNGGGEILSAGDIVYWECKAVAADGLGFTAGFDIELVDV